jgi:hypothetical protein
MQRFVRLDARQEKRYYKDDGTLIIPCYLSRTGTLLYASPRGQRGEFRADSDLFSTETIESFKGIPVTINHPPGGIVTSENWRDLAVGFVGWDVKQDGIYLAANLHITDKKAIERIEKGELLEVSAGYKCAFVRTDGEDEEGVKYQYRQVKIRGNHLALLPRNMQGRAGKNVRLL